MFHIWWLNEKTNLELLSCSEVSWFVFRPELFWLLFFNFLLQVIWSLFPFSLILITDSWSCAFCCRGKRKGQSWVGANEQSSVHGAGGGENHPQPNWRDPQLHDGAEERLLRTDEQVGPLPHGHRQRLHGSPDRGVCTKTPFVYSEDKWAHTHWLLFCFRNRKWTNLTRSMAKKSKRLRRTAPTTNSSKKWS